MSPQALESRKIQIICRVIGWPITILAVLLAIDGIGIGLGGLAHRNIWPIIFGGGTLLSYLGLLGAWWRLNVRYETMSVRKTKIVRNLLVIGILGACALAIGAAGIFGLYGLAGSVVFVMFGFAGIVFLNATPKRF